MAEDQTPAELDEEPFPVPAEIGVEDVTMLLVSVPERVGDLLTGLTADQLAYRHGPAFPTADEVARHLAAAGGALDATVASVSLGTAPPEADAAGDAALTDLLADWQRRRRRAADLLRGLPGERWEELKEVAEQGLQHELAHLSQLRNLTALIPVA